MALPSLNEESRAQNHRSVYDYSSEDQETYGSQDLAQPAQAAGQHEPVSPVYSRVVNAPSQAGSEGAVSEADIDDMDLCDTPPDPESPPADSRYPSAAYDLAWDYGDCSDGPHASLLNPESGQGEGAVPPGQEEEEAEEDEEQAQGEDGESEEEEEEIQGRQRPADMTHPPYLPAALEGTVSSH